MSATNYTRCIQVDDIVYVSQGGLFWNQSLITKESLTIPTRALKQREIRPGNGDMRKAFYLCAKEVNFFLPRTVDENWNSAFSTRRNAKRHMGTTYGDHWTCTAAFW